MGIFNKAFKLTGLLSISTALAVVIVAAATTGTQAQIRTNSVSFGPRGGMGGSLGGGGGMSMGGTSFRTEPRFQRFQNDTVVTGDDDRPGRRPPGKRPPKHVGPVIGTGVVTVTTGPTGAGPRRPPVSSVYLPPANELRFVKDEVLLGFNGRVSPQVSTAISTRNRLTRVESVYLPLIDITMFRWKIDDGRPVSTVLNQLGRERGAGMVFRQPNFIFSTSQSQSGAAADANAGMTLQAAPEPTQDSKTEPKPAAAAAAALPQAAGDPAQYALRKLHLGEAHNLANGDKVLVAVIDSGVDLSHPELKGAVAGSFDALDKPEKPHTHGTAIAGAIVAHARLMGAAPAARILAIRAFGTTGAGSDATTMAIIKGLKYATDEKARVINMSFAGPTDPGLGRYLAAAKASGAVLVAAAGNFGPKSGPQYPAADPNVIAVSATDTNDQIFKASNVGPHIAVTAPGVDILLPAPDNDYQLTSGTSFSAAYVSGVVALILQRAPELKPEGVRKILEQTAKDLGPTGKDPEYGAGLVDAYRAILAVQSGAAAAAGQGAPQRRMTAQ